MLARYETIEAIPDDAADWDIPLRGRDRLAQTLAKERELAMLFRDLATLRTTAEVFDDIDELHWRGPTAAFEPFCARLRAGPLLRRAQAAAEARV